MQKTLKRLVTQRDNKIVMNVVTGMHRSGTTYVGKILDACDQLDVFHEPFNRHFGISGINKNYPAVDMGYELNTVDILKSIESRQQLPFIRDCNKDKFTKKLARKIIGGKTEQQWRKIRLSHSLKEKQLVLKDPFLSMSTQTLTKDLGVKVLFLCRHPGSVWASIKQMNWKMDLDNFFGDGFPINKQKDDLATFCEVWNTINLHNTTIEDANYLFMTHEELCIDPLGAFKQVFDHFNLPLSEKANALIEDMTSGGQADKQSNKLHQFKRNSAEMVNLWQKKLSKEEIDYIYGNTTTRSLIENLYGNSIQP